MQFWRAPGILFVSVAFFGLLLSPDALPRVNQLGLKEKKLQADIINLKLDIINLGEEIDLLSGKTLTSTNYIKRLARNEMGMIALGEKRINVGRYH